MPGVIVFMVVADFSTVEADDGETEDELEEAESCIQHEAELGSFAFWGVVDCCAWGCAGWVAA